MLLRMSHEDYVPAEQTPDYTFDPATLYQTLPRPAAIRLPEPPPALSARLAKIGLGLAFAGVVLLLIGEQRIARAEATEGWIETSAVISSAKLAAQGEDYHLDVLYRYRAGPRERQGTRIALEPDLSRDAAYAYAARFRPGARVTAWFDSAEPESVVLDRPNIAAPYALSIIGGALVAAGLMPFAHQLLRQLRYRIALRRASGI
jgi:hypothetical protein